MTTFKTRVTARTETFSNESTSKGSSKVSHADTMTPTGSVGGRAGYPGTGTYSASKGAIEAYTRNWAAELGKDGTTVNAVNPGPVESEMLDQVDPQVVDAQKKATPIESRVGKAEEVAAIIAFLAEDRSSWVTGQCISARSDFSLVLLGF